MALFRNVALAAGTVTLTAAGLAVAPPTAAADTGPPSVLFDYTGSAQTYTVPQAPT